MHYMLYIWGADAPPQVSPLGSEGLLHRDSLAETKTGPSLEDSSRFTGRISMTVFTKNKNDILKFFDKAQLRFAGVSIEWREAHKP